MSYFKEYLFDLHTPVFFQALVKELRADPNLPQEEKDVEDGWGPPWQLNPQVHAVSGLLLGRFDMVTYEI